ncbi:MAG: hypothetical protein WD425_00300 [Nitrospirales bacterium]
MHRFHVIFILACVWVAPMAYGQDAPEGIRPLIVLEEPIHTVIPSGLMFLNEPKTTEQFLTKLEKHPPDWTYLYGKNVDERYDRLFDESEKRDALRIGNPNLTQPIAFLWDGFLTRVRDDKSGFAVSIGPRQIQTSWGIVRFKLANEPRAMTAMPPPELFEALKKKRSQTEEVAIMILYRGTLVPEESLMYDFSTKQEGEGMILPIVELTQVDYFIPKSEAPSP